MNGSTSSRVTKIARIFGTNTRVCSWIWVSAWNSDTMTPTTRPTTISGDDTTTMVQIASRATSRVSGPVIFLAPLSPSSFRGAPLGASPESILRMVVMDYGLAALRRPGMTMLKSNRHPHDVFVGLDHAVAHRDQGGNCNVGFRHRRHHVHDVGLAGRHRHGLRVGFLAGIDDVADGVLEHRAEGGAARLGASLPGIRLAN